MLANTLNCLGFVVMLLAAQAFARSDQPLNVVMIMADDVGYECFGCYGSREYRTPRIDALAAEGIRFANCHSTPLCTPSRVNLSTMTGRSTTR